MRRVFIFLLLLSAASGCKKTEWAVTSEHPQQQITIDGDAAEWGESLRFDDEARLGYAICNDSEFLYICLKADKQVFQQAMRGGLTVWFDSTAKAKEILGIHYPIGMQKGEPGSHPEGQSQDKPGQGERPAMDKRQHTTFGEMEILGPEKDDKNRASAQNNFGIQAAIGGLPDEPVYELKIPLQTAKGRPYAVEAALGAEISIGLESGKIEQMQGAGRGAGGGHGGMGGGGGMGPDGSGGGPDGGGSGGMRPGGGGGMGPGGGAPPGMDGNQSANSDPIRLWLRVQLAK